MTSKLIEAARSFSRNESGGLMALALLGALSATGSSTSDKWDGVSEDVGDAMNGAGS